MHPKDDLLRAMLDHELGENQRYLLSQHLRHCPQCANRLNALQKVSQTVNASLDHLAPQHNEAPQAAHIAYQKLLSNHKESSQTMFTKRSTWAYLAVIAVLAIALTITPVRAWASSVLSLFRVEQVTVISFDPQAMREGRGSMAQNEEAFQQIFKDKLEIVEQGEGKTVGSLSEARQAVGFNLRLPERSDAVQYYVKPGLTASLTIDQPTLQAMMDAANIDMQIAASLDGKVVTLEMPTALIAAYGDCPSVDDPTELPAGCTTLLQVPSPSVNAPEGFDSASMGEAMLQFLGYSPEEASRLSARIDWTSTLILPIPQGEGIAYQDVPVDGVPATFLTQADSPEYMLIWIKDSILYALQGSGNLNDALSIVTSLR